MTNPRQLAGVLPIVHTPFTDGDAIDEASLRRQLDWAFDTGAESFRVARCYSGRGEDFRG